MGAIKRTRKIENPDNSNCLDNNDLLKKTRSNLEMCKNYLSFEDDRKFYSFESEIPKQNDPKISVQYSPDKHSYGNDSNKSPQNNFNDNLRNVNKIICYKNLSNIINYNEKSKDFSGYSDKIPEENLHQNLN